MRARFTTDEIGAAALEIVDAAGLNALSMRSLAAALGTGPMTVYNYVADKEGLEELVVAAVVAGAWLSRRPQRTLGLDRSQRFGLALGAFCGRGGRGHRLRPESFEPLASASASR